MYGHSYFRSRREIVSLPWVCFANRRGRGMARISTVIQKVYHRPGGRRPAPHLADRYGIPRVMRHGVRLTEGVFRVDRDLSPPWSGTDRMLTGKPAVPAHRGGRRDTPLPGAPGIPGRALRGPQPGHQRARRPVRSWSPSTSLASTRPAAPPCGASSATCLCGCTLCPPSPGPARPRASTRTAACRSSRAARAPISPRPPALLADLDGRVPAEHWQLSWLIAELLPGEGDDAQGACQGAFIHPDPVRNNVVIAPGGPGTGGLGRRQNGPRPGLLVGTSPCMMRARSARRRRAGRLPRAASI